MRRFFILVSVVAGFSGAVDAQNAPPISSSQFDVSELMQTLPERTLKTLRKAPDKFIEDAVTLILGYGSEAGIDLAGIEQSIAMDRAYVRAREMRRLMVADLDNDYAVSLAEIRVLISAERAGGRGRLLLGFQAADQDNNNVVSQQELRNFSQIRALDRLSEEDAARLRGFMAFDLDRDGLVQVEEVISVVQAFRPEA